MNPLALVNEFIVAATAPRGAHASGTLEEADAILAAHPGVARLLLDLGVPVSDDVVALAERALTEGSDFTPHHSREILDLLHGVR